MQINEVACYRTDGFASIVYKLSDLGQTGSNRNVDVKVIVEGNELHSFDFANIGPAVSDDGDQLYMLTLPLLRKKVEVQLIARDAEGEPIAEFKKTYSPFNMKWSSRLNYRLHPQLARMVKSRLRDLPANQPAITFSELIRKDEKGNGLLRIKWKLYSDSEDDVSIECYSGDGRRIDSKSTITQDEMLTDELHPETRYRSIQATLEVPFDEPMLLLSPSINGERIDCVVVLSGKARLKAIEAGSRNERHASFDQSYADWFNQRRAKEADLSYQREAALPTMPKFSIVVPMYNTKPEFLDELLDSVLRQSYQNWELILANASPENETLVHAIEEAASADDRIVAIGLPENLGIAENTNKGIERATGDFICFLDHDDTIEPDTLFEYARAISDHPEVDLLYCDEDLINFEGAYFGPFFKPPFSIDQLRARNYVCHFLTIRKSLLDNLEGLSGKYDGAQDYDLVLQASEKARYIHHVPKVLYHWRLSEGSTAVSAEEKPYAAQAGVRALQNHLDRMGIDAVAKEDKLPTSYDVDYKVADPKPLVSMIIPVMHSADLLRGCIQSIVEKTDYPSYEIIVAIKEEADRPDIQALSDEFDCVRIAANSRTDSYSKMINDCVKEANGNYILLLHDDIELISHDWVYRMVGQCQRPEVGAVGAKLLFADDTVQHGGMALMDNTAKSLNVSFPREDVGYAGTLITMQNLSAVSGACMMTKRCAFEQVGGFSEELTVEFSDVDYCLKLREAGYLVIFNPKIELYHYVPVTTEYEFGDAARYQLNEDRLYMNGRWKELFAYGDPYINENFKLVDNANQGYALIF